MFSLQIIQIGLLVDKTIKKISNKIKEISEFMTAKKTQYNSRTATTNPFRSIKGATCVRLYSAMYAMSPLCVLIRQPNHVANAIITFQKCRKNLHFAKKKAMQIATFCVRV